MIKMKRTLLMGQFIFQSVCWGGPLCAPEDYQDLKQKNYNSFEVDLICNGGPSFYESVISLEKGKVKEMQNKLVGDGCVDAKLIQDKSRAQEYYFKLISRNCAIIDSGTSCPDGLNMKPGKVSDHAQYFSLCISNRKSILSRANGSN